VIALAACVVTGPSVAGAVASGSPGGSSPAPRQIVVASTHLVVASTGDATTGGYWLAASDGGVFSFGAPFEGSAGALPLVKPVVGMAPTSDFQGYWLVASDGGVFAFGDARFLGSMGGIRLSSPVVGMQSGGTAGGYRLVAADGGLFSFGALFAGSAVGLLQRSAVSLDSSGTGYRVVSADGSVYDFGGADYLGSVQVPPLVGEVVTIDPGHDGGNASDPSFVDRPIDGGGFTEPCDTAGTETASGYPEHAFNFDVATRLAALLQAGGATVVLTRPTDTGVGPCVNARAAIGNDAGSDAAVSIHADGGPVTGRGFAVDVPVPVVSSISNDTAIVPASDQLGSDVRNSFLQDTGEQVSDYAGNDGIDPRDDLGGLNLSTVPKVLVECANMQNPTDAAVTESPAWRQQAAQGLADGITAFLVQREVP
jgi:N-acetylmuramoyl-L-alanine amidase